MKFSISAQAVTALISVSLQLAEAKSVKSELFDWQYELVASAPAITTKDEMYATASAWNQTVSIELLDGAMSLVDQVSKKQVAVFDGGLNEWARAAYPTQDQIANMKSSGGAASLKSEMTGILAAVAAGTPMTEAVTNAAAARRAVQGDNGLEKRQNCACPVVIFSCQLIGGCSGACVFFLCI